MDLLSILSLLLTSHLSLLSADCPSGQWQCSDGSCLLREKVSCLVP